MDSLTSIPDYIELNNQELEKIKMKGLKSRLKNDCNMLYKEYHNVLIVVKDGEPITISADEFIYMCKTVNNQEIVTVKKRTYKFILTIQYPFHPPKIFVNNHPYMSILQTRSDYEKDMVKKIKGNDCLCCHSINCSANWSPAIKLDRIINEVKNILKFKRDIINVLLADKIKKKYNIPYAYIELYLI